MGCDLGKSGNCQGGMPREGITSGVEEAPQNSLKEPARVGRVSGSKELGLNATTAAKKKRDEDFSDTPQMIEVCCGCARLTKAFVDLGIPAVGIDQATNRHLPEGPHLTVDIGSQEGVGEVSQLIKSAAQRLQLVWLGIPCGTASRAREIPLGGQKKPRPLRTASEPWGIASNDFDQEEATQLEKANNLWWNALHLIRLCDELKIPWAIENPFDSLLWYTEEYAELIHRKTAGAVDAVYHACMFGSERKKRQRVRTTSAAVQQRLHQVDCDNGHPHRPWRVHGCFQTAEEAEYPEQFCRTIAELFHPIAADSIETKNEEFARGALKAAKRPKTQRAKAATGIQPRAGKYEQLVSEYKCIILRRLPCEFREEAGKCVEDNKGWLPAALAEKIGAPNPSRILDMVQSGVQGIEELDGEGGEDRRHNDIVKLGVPWEPVEFIEQASKLVHPFDGQACITDRAKIAIFDCLTSGVQGMKAKRKKVFEHWQARAAELDDQERQLFKAADPAVQPCWGGKPSAEEALEGRWTGKRSLLFEEMAKEAGVPNARLLADYIRSGGPHLGECPPSGLYEHEETPATKTFKEVLQASQWSRPKVRAMGPSREAWVDREVLDRTEAEVEEGKALGPFTEDEVSAIVGKLWAPVRRVGLVQSSGVRPIDDFSEFGHNGTSHTFERIDLGGIDEVVGIAKVWLQAPVDGERVRVQLESGVWLEEQLHPDYKDAKNRRVSGRALDLRRAFKQLAVRPSMRAVSIIAIWHPGEKGVRYYILRAMPFGARNAVYIFGSVARALDHILTNLFSFSVSQYVDDFPQVELDSLQGGIQAEQVFELLGWEVKKNDQGIVPPFSEEFTALGVIFNFSGWEKGQLEVRNKPERAERAERLVKLMLDQPGRMGAVAGELSGVLAFSRAQCYGRCGAYALRILADIAAGRIRKVDDAVKEHLLFWPDFLRKAKPRRIVVKKSPQKPALIFVDGAEETSGVGVGAVLICPATGRKEAFGGNLPDELPAAWRREGQKEKVIHQAELLPALLSMVAWGEMLEERQVFLFVDNDAARAAVVKGTTNNFPSARIVAKIWEIAVVRGIQLWVERVPSWSNVADGPSRNEWQEARELGCKRLELPATG